MSNTPKRLACIIWVGDEGSMCFHCHAPYIWVEVTPRVSHLRYPAHNRHVCARCSTVLGPMEQTTKERQALRDAQRDAERIRAAEMSNILKKVADLQMQAFKAEKAFQAFRDVSAS